MKYWAKVKNPKEKPLKWWYYKVLCELGYFIEQEFVSTAGMRMYYDNLFKLCALGYNLYGEKFTNGNRL